MNKLKTLFSPPSPQGHYHEFLVRCRRCNETISGQINLSNDPSLEFDERGKPYYVCRKVLIGSGSCFQSIEVVFHYNEQREVKSREITGGEFLET